MPAVNRAGGRGPFPGTIESAGCRVQAHHRADDRWGRAYPAYWGARALSSAASIPGCRWPEMSDVTRLLEEARSGDPRAWDLAVALVYDDLKRVARGVLGGPGGATLNATALVHDCYLRLARAGPDGVLNRSHFLALAARAMRQLMLNHARDKLALKRGAGAVHTDVDAHAERLADEAEQLLELDSALAKLQSENPDWVRVVECRVFAGLTEQETADAIGESLRTSQRVWADARARLAVLLAA